MEYNEERARQREDRGVGTHLASKCANEKGDGPRNEAAAAVAASALRVEKECRPVEAIFAAVVGCCCRSRSMANARPAIAATLGRQAAGCAHPLGCD